MKTKYLVLILFPVFIFLTFLTIPYSFSSEKVTVVEGLIESVTADSIYVRGRYYNYTNVPLKDASGRTVLKTELQKGKKVEIFFRDGTITTILVHEYMRE